MVCCQNRVLNEIALVVGKCGFAKLMRQPETQFSVAKTSHARFCKAKTEGKRSKHGKQRKQDFQAAST